MRPAAPRKSGHLLRVVLTTLLLSLGAVVLTARGSQLKTHRTPKKPSGNAGFVEDFAA